MQDLTPEQWETAAKIAEQGPLFAVLVGFIVALFRQTIVWGHQVVKFETKCDAKIAQLESKIDKFEAQHAEMMELVKVSAMTASGSVEGFKRALDALERLETTRSGGEERRRAKP